jgi:hypothetical protein
MGFKAISKSARRIYLFCLIVLIIAPLPAYADYHYASHEGTSEYPYTSWATAADSIQLAIEAASAYDTVFIGAGDWHETIGMQEWDSLMALIGMGMDSTRIWWEVSNRAVIYTAHKSLLKGIHFHHTGGFCNIYSLQDRDLTALDCKFTAGWGIAAWRSKVFVENCIFEQVHEGISHDWGGKLIVQNCLFNGAEFPCVNTQRSVSLIQNNIFINMQANSISFEYYPDSSLVENNLVYNTYAGLNGRIAYGGDLYSVTRNNTLYLRQNWQFYDGIIATEHNAQYVNNNIVGAYHGFRVGGDTIIIRYNNLWDNIEDYLVFCYIDTIGNIYQDPMFIGNWDFHLQAYSPLIDAGDPDILDLDGSRSDIGVYGGPGGESYTYLDLAPQIPDSIEVAFDSNAVLLNWRMNTEADFNRYQVYRDTIAGFEPNLFDIIAEPETAFYEDDDIVPGVSYYYRLTSVDNQGNISDYSEEVAAIPTYIPGFQSDELIYTSISKAYPNPANSQVTIVYSASNLGPQPPEIRLQIFDIQGRVVKTLVDEKKPMGTYRAVWDGTNDDREPVASGTYIARVFQWGQDAGDFPVKITLVK